ncbi:AAA family ATPase [Gimesia maris]|uniref:Recombination protein F n=1 Tax=Gimesia maris TaxID=122 RepID=A0ABX5YW61_9PLAN|nr:AAA family ATPase [Gimesia maris]EDL60603.1 hypothetical protein PM8797T_11144 [Gimesia maris DSM 8797]QEG19887.1 recombination protein F [Gimesia maris]QGQ27306.1 AAA family ATPase [Gimesia maris]
MSLNLQSQNVINKLLDGSNITSGKVSLGPLSPSEKLILRIIIEDKDAISNKTGESLASDVRSSYLIAKEAVEKSDENRIKDELQPLAEVDLEIPAKRSYLLADLTCKSFRGIAPAGEKVHFSFDTKSNLIYGPNGSGKTSLLGAVIWVLTGSAISDANDTSETAPVHAISNSGSKGSKITDWPVVATLPEGNITKTTEQECFAQVKLISQDRQHELHLRRSISNGLEHSSDETDWKNCSNLEQFGIHSLDLQLSLLAPTVFGRFSVEDAPDTKSLLSLMLGYDDLIILGDLASKIARNRTSLVTKETNSIDKEWSELTEKLQAISEKPLVSENILEIIKPLRIKSEATLDQIDTVGKQLSNLVKDSQSYLANLLGLSHEEESENKIDYAEILTGAINLLEQNVWTIFPGLGALRIDELFPSSDDCSSLESFQAICKQFNEFLHPVIERIINRWKWWQSEVRPASNATLLLIAAGYYDPNSEICPVCEQSISSSPVKDELERLKSHDAELKKEIKSFFRELCDELDAIIPTSVSNLAKSSPVERLNNDWQKLAESSLPSAFSPLVQKFNPHIEGMASQLQIEKNEPIQILPDGVEPEFAEYASAFIQKIEDIRTSIAYLDWSSINLEGTKTSIQSLITSSSEEHTESLLNNISVGKKTAREIKPLKDILNILRCAYKKRVEISEKENALKLLEELKSPLDTLKNIKKFAENEVEITFGEIQSKTIDIWKIMYPESSSGLTPAKLTVGKGHAKSVTAFLTKNEAYEVPGQFFGNAGLQRSVALAFYFALLDNHPKGIGFSIMDDPILSLDDSHRERWSRDILKPKMKLFQFIIATHQKHYLNSCRSDFVDGNVYQLNDRSWPRQISRRPGERLKRAIEEMENSPDNVPNQLRMYCEELLRTIETYAPNSFYRQNSFSNSVDSYKSISNSGHLASKWNKSIIQRLQDTRVTNVLNPGSHHETQPNVTNEMIRDCLDQLIECDKEFKEELKRLEKEYEHRRKKAVINTSLSNFAGLPETSFWSQPIRIKCYGQAAAKGEHWEVDFSENPIDMFIPIGSAVLVSSNSLDPVARLGQWVLLAEEDISCDDGDLVAATTTTGDRLLRRIWSNGDIWSLQSINSVDPTVNIQELKTESTPRKIIGVLYEPNTKPKSPQNDRLSEWQPHGIFKGDWFKKLASVSVSGNSLDPIARAGQKVLIEKDHVASFSEIRNGDLAVIDTSVNGVGRVIKRVFHQASQCILISPNPIDPHPPLILNKYELFEAKFWPVCGVLFESNDELVSLS